jgi:hypothetical protein
VTWQSANIANLLLNLEIRVAGATAQSMELEHYSAQLASVPIVHYCHVVGLLAMTNNR